MQVLLSFFKKSDENLVAVVKKFISILEIKVSNTSIEESLLSHPDFPSLFSISECFDRWNIENAALNLDSESIKQLEAPFITSVRENNQMNFVIVTEITDSNVTFIKDNVRIKILREVFLQNWSGTVFIAEKNDYSGEVNYEEKRKKELINLASVILVNLGLLGLVIYCFFNWNIYNERFILIGVVQAFGILFSWLLISSQYGIRDFGFCKIGGKSDCNLVLNSKISKVFGVNLSEIGVLFFLFNFVLLCFASGDFESEYFQIVGFLSFLSLPFTLFSIFYQWKVVKSWCVLCLIVQFLLWINFILIPNDIEIYLVTFEALFNSLIIFLIIGAIQYGLTRIFVNSIENKKWKFKYFQLKTNKEIFLNHLKSQPTFPTVHPSPMGIILGNPLSEHTITFITNPFCEPCAKMHKELEQAIRGSDKIKIEIFFYATKGKSQQVAQHFLSLYFGGKNVSDALEFWYGTKGRDFDSLKNVFPSPPNDQYLQEVEQHYQWCIDSKIPHTPFLYINGFQAPTTYTMEEVFLLLSSLSSEDFEKVLV